MWLKYNYTRTVPITDGLFIFNSVSDPCHFGMDPDADPAPEPALFFFSFLQDANKKYFFFLICFA